jgi:hypothetical protein
MADALSVAFEVPDDTPPSISDVSASKDVAPLRCQEPGCLAEIVKPARGRTPKFCDEHKGAKASGTKSSLTGKSWPKAKEVEALLNQYVAGLGMGVSFLNQEDGEIIVDKAPAVVHELVKLAADDKRLRTYLEFLATPGKYAPLSLACFSLILPILANHGIVDKFIAGLITEGR